MNGAMRKVSCVFSILVLQETSPGGTEVYTFTFTWGSGGTRVPSISVSPSAGSSFFQTRENGYTQTITLTSHATLNYKITNQYTIGVSLPPSAATLYVVILQAPKCDRQFASSGGATVRVQENLAPSFILYAVNPEDFGPFQYTLSSSPQAPFTIDKIGIVRSPSSGFILDERKYILSITVEGGGTSCSGTLNIEVLPVEIPAVTFTLGNQTVTATENSGPFTAVARVSAISNIGADVYYLIKSPNSAGPHHFQINQRTGMIRTIHNLDLEASPLLNVTHLLVVAYDPLHKVSATATVAVAVLERYGLASVNCVDGDRTSTRLTYHVVADNRSMGKFQVSTTGGLLKVNGTLDLDSSGPNCEDFRYTAHVVVTDNGVPPLTTTVPVYVTVTLVNEFDPVFTSCEHLSVREDAAPGTTIGSVSATDRDCPHTVRYSVVGTTGQSPIRFYVGPSSGQIHLLSHLDFEEQTSYGLQIEAVDIDQDSAPEPKNQRTAVCTLIVNVENVNDNPPVCDPPHYRASILSTLSAAVEILTVACSDADNPTQDLVYSVAGGNTNNRFAMNGDRLVSRGAFSFQTPGVFDPTVYELSVRVEDRGTPVLSTIATVIVSVVPWTTTRPTTTTTASPPQIEVVGLLVQEWTPPLWFVAVLTAAGILLLLSLAALLWRCVSGCRQAPVTCPQLPDRGQNAERETPASKPLQTDRGTAEKDLVLNWESLKSFEVKLLYSFLDNKKHMASFTNGVFLLCIYLLLAAVTAINLTFFPCDIISTKLDCSQRNFLQVPSILHSNSVLSLNLDRNNIREVVRGAFAGVPNLQNLTMSWNCPPGRLRALGLPPCEMKIDRDAFAPLRNLSRLVLAGNSLRHVPALPGNLTFLSLEYNRLFNFTTPLGTPHLEQLLLARNCYYANPCNGTFTIDESVFQGLPVLRNLTLGFNSIAEVPRGLPPSLVSLDLRENKISEINDMAFANLSSLTHLNLEWNCQRCDHAAQPCFPCPNNASINLTQKAFWHQENITSLSLRGNSLRKLPDSLFWNLRRLTDLDLSDNLLAYVIRNGTFFKYLKNVTTLNLIYNYEPRRTFNNLSLSRHFKEMKNLKNLLLSGYFFNRIDMYYRAAFQEVRDTLKVLDLSYNAFHFSMKGMGHGFEFIQSLTSLEVLSLAENNIGMRISRQLNSSSLKYLFFAGNRLDIMWDNKDDRYITFFEQLINLTYLDISKNNLEYFTPEALSHLPQSLTTLKVSDNKLYYFPWTNLSSLSNLCCLNLSRNYLTSLPSEVTSPKLLTLDLSHNRISHLVDDFFRNASSLHTLLLSYNRLKFLDSQNLPPQHGRLRMLTLHGNPFECSCNTSWFPDFLMNTSITIPQLTTNIRCGFPESLQGEIVLSMDPRSCQESDVWFLCTFLLTVVFTVVPLLNRLFGWDLWYCIQVFWAGHKGYSVLQGNSSQHDAFVVFDTGNAVVRDWVYNELAVNLEDRGIRRFTLCLEERDWVPGFACIDNLHNAVYNSSKTIFVLTNNGPVSGILKQTFYMVQQRLLDEKIDVVVLVLLDEVFPKLKYLQMRKRLCRNLLIVTIRIVVLSTKMRKATATE
ncbi:hypothetical protein AAFF_G00041750 [Aldrovandia affinis]|uniref:Uncharacterized protein n=1 Tax=Aldrovandia affinis TaxID=143900 RepID=A0AAD7S2R6_9TELE|nr:hypothetical protein AAFF_G00041750 [Aldrovandia affinis]